MANLTSKNGNEYHVLDFSNLNDRGLAPLKKSLERLGIKVARLFPPSAARRKDGVLLRTVSMRMQDEQDVTLQVNETGDVSAITVNKKPLPYTGAKNLNELAKTIAEGVKGGAQAFARQLARKLAKASREDEQTTNKPVLKSNAQRLAEQKNRVSVATAQITAAEKKQAEHDAQAATLRVEVTDLNTKLSAARTLNTQLKETLAQLQKETASE